MSFIFPCRRGKPCMFAYPMFSPSPLLTLRSWYTTFTFHLPDLISPLVPFLLSGFPAFVQPMKHRYLDVDSATDLGHPWPRLLGEWKDAWPRCLQVLWRFAHALLHRRVAGLMLHKPWQIGISVYHGNDIFTLSFGERQTSNGFEGPTVNHIFFVATGVAFVPGLSWLPGTRYQGQFRDNIREGYGVLTAPPACSLAGLLDVFCWTGLIQQYFGWFAGWFCWTIYDNQPTMKSINTFQDNDWQRCRWHFFFLIFVPQGGFYLKAITPSPMQICSLPVHGWQPVWRGLARRCTRGRLEKGRLVDAEMVFWRVFAWFCLYICGYHLKPNSMNVWILHWQ